MLPFISAQTTWIESKRIQIWAVDCSVNVRAVDCRDGQIGLFAPALQGMLPSSIPAKLCQAAVHLGTDGSDWIWGHTNLSRWLLGKHPSRWLPRWTVGLIALHPLCRECLAASPIPNISPLENIGISWVNQRRGASIDDCYLEFFRLLTPPL